MLYVINKIMFDHYSEEFIPIEGKTKVAKILTKFADVQYGLEEDIQFVSKDENRQQMFVYLNTLERVKPVIDFIAKNLDALVYEIKKLPINSQNRVEVLRNFILENPPLQLKQEEFVIPGVDVKFMRLLSFPVSKRPITDMARFWDRYDTTSREFVDITKIPLELQLRPADSASILYEGGSWSVSYEQLFYIPILRYEGMSRNMFYDPADFEESSSESLPEDGYCGTFFYYEAESPAWLKTENTCIAATKTHALKVLGMPFDEAFLKWEGRFEEDHIAQLYAPIESILGIPENQISQKYVKSKNTTKELNSANKPVYSARYLARKLIQKMYDLNYVFDEFDNALYAFEDYFDQVLCEYAKSKEVDTVLLTHMTGSSRIVSEVLDTRDRNTIFNNMIINRV